MVEHPICGGVRDAALGVFSTRTPVRLNPIAAQTVEILAVRDGEINVMGLDRIDGTPLLDIKRERCDKVVQTFARPARDM